MLNKIILTLCLVSGIAGCASAAEVKLNSSDGSTKFIVRDGDAAAVFGVDSDGNTVLNGTAAVAGSEFSVGGSTLAVKGGKVGIGTAAPVTALDVNGGVRVGNYVDASIPSPAGLAGTFIFNTTLGKPYVSDGTAWKPLGKDIPGPAVGGAWLRVPGDPSLGTLNFWVQKYEAKNVGNVPTSQASGTPWVSVTQTSAKTYCTALGSGYHLLTMDEAQTISRNIENNAWNWDGGAVGSGGLWHGHTDVSPNNALAADVTGGPDDDPYVGTGNVTPSIEKRIHQISTGEYIWDWSGNVWEWVDMTCTPGSGAGYWYNSGIWIEWSDVNLSDYEKARAGPAGATPAQNTGAYFGCTSIGNAVRRGGDWVHGGAAGVFSFHGNASPSYSFTGIGFRCGK